VAHMREERYVQDFGGVIRGKRQLGRRRRRWDDTKIDLKEVGWRGMECIV